ncbi:odorant receptor 22b-like isoform X1 [Diachasmimorpha longicaudata]|uniref:odorant receptor 22b-like isoform X1 n=1 Tax=Diachasmimorpha longicaudata TaxID=58733 RepID=UPI0030B8900E
MSQRRVSDIFEQPVVSDTYYLGFNLKCLIFCGLWNPYNSHGKWLYNAYTVVIVLLLPLVKLEGYVMSMRNPQQSFIQQTLQIFIISVFSVGWLKHVNLLWHQSDIAFIATVFHWERSVVCSAEVALYRNKVLTDTMKFLKKWTTIWLWLIIFDTPLIYRDNLDGNVLALPISFTIFRHYVEEMNFFTALFIDWLTLITFSWSVIANDSLFLTLMLHMRAQLKILNFRLKRCANPVRDYQCATTLPSNFECPNRNVNIRQPNRIQEFIICIQHYQKLFGLMRILNRIYGSVLLPQLLSSISLIALIGIHVFVTQTINPKEPSSALVLLLSLASALMEVGVYCCGGDTVIVESDLTKLAVYNSYWYLEDTEFKTTLITFLAMAQQPFSIRAGGIFEISLVTLKSVFSKSYSAMAILQRSLG